MKYSKQEVNEFCYIWLLRCQRILLFVVIVFWKFIDFFSLQGFFFIFKSSMIVFVFKVKLFFGNYGDIKDIVK